MCAYQKPLARALRSVPYRHGECGSPSRSENLWCLRWSATHRMTGPWIAIEPAIARATLTARLGLNDLCVKRRWKPTVMPWPVSQYMTTMRRTSVQPSQPPQATGTAAAIARNGTTMKTARATCSLRDCTSAPQVARSGPGSASLSAGCGAVAVGDEVIGWFLAKCS